jgi:hypothetical protein
VPKRKPDFPHFHEVPLVLAAIRPAYRKCRKQELGNVIAATDAKFGSARITTTGCG